MQYRITEVTTYNLRKRRKTTDKMKCILGLMFLVALEATVSVRQKRDVIQFGDMIECTTTHQMMDYCGYGRWCGHGGSGEPLDEIDSCCKEHDLCWRNLGKNKNCISSLFYFKGYTYSKTNCNKEEVTIECENYNECEKRLCECDKEAAFCFQEFESKFNDHYKDYSSCFLK